MTAKQKILALGLSALLLTACSNKLEEGQVSKKRFTPAHTATTVQLVPIYSGQSTSFISIPRTTYYPEQWRITIQGEAEGKEKTATYSVSEEIYDAFEVGDFVTIADLGVAQ